MNDFLTEKIEKLGIELNNVQTEQFEKYYELLVDWNKVMNLTAITKYEEVVEKHFLDSLTLVKALDRKTIESEIETVIDIGTGAGFPGIPLKIVFPDLNITLLDSLNKRIKFLNMVIDELGLEGIKSIHGRAEDFAKQKEYREKYDLCVSRAVANLATLSEYCLPYVKKEGYFTPYKSGDIDEELESSKGAIQILGGDVKKVARFELPETDIKRSIIVIKKIKNTNKKYPRKAGMPSKEPLTL